MVMTHFIVNVIQCTTLGIAWKGMIEQDKAHANAILSGIYLKSVLFTVIERLFHIYRHLQVL